MDDPVAECRVYADEVLPLMDDLRKAVDSAEPLCGIDYWPVPTYNDMLFYV